MAAKNFKHTLLCLLLGGLLVLSACQPAATDQTTYTETGDAKSACDDSQKEFTTPAKPTDHLPAVFFYEDILPILNSTSSEKKYKCIACHSEYETPHELMKPNEIANVLNSIKSGKMPVGGTKMLPEDVLKIEKWSDEGFFLVPGDELKAQKQQQKNTNCS